MKNKVLKCATQQKEHSSSRARFINIKNSESPTRKIGLVMRKKVDLI